MRARPPPRQTNLGGAAIAVFTGTSSSSITIDGCVFELNTGGSALTGVVNFATAGAVVITNSRFANNSMLGGGAVRHEGDSGPAGPLTISDTVFSDNAGGCIVAGLVDGSLQASSVIISRSTFRRCAVAASASLTTGSALRATLVSTGVTSITDSLFEGNVATGDSASGGTVAIIGTTAGSGTATVTRSTFGGNVIGVANTAGTGAVGAHEAQALAFALLPCARACACLWVPAHASKGRARTCRNVHTQKRASAPHPTLKSAMPILPPACAAGALFITNLGNATLLSSTVTGERGRGG